MSLSIRPAASAQCDFHRNRRLIPSVNTAAEKTSVPAKGSGAEETWKANWEKFVASVPVLHSNVPNQEAATVDTEAKCPAQMYTGPKTDTDYKENADLRQAFYFLQGTAGDMRNGASLLDIMQYREGILQDPNASEDDRKTSEIVLPFEKNFYQEKVGWIEGKEQESSWLDDFVQKYNNSVVPDETKESDDALLAAKNFLQGILGDVNSESLGLMGLSDKDEDQAKQALNQAAGILDQKADQIAAAYQKRTGTTLDPISSEPISEFGWIRGVEVERFWNHEPSLFSGCDSYHLQGGPNVFANVKVIDPSTYSEQEKQIIQTLNQTVFDVYA